VIDLGLERTEDELQPANPLAEVGIPQELGEGIKIPGAGIRVGLPGAPAERSPSIIDQSVAGYPNVAHDTTFAVAPTPTGFETMTLLQSADAPTSQIYELDLPQGASLTETEGGGAEAQSGEESLLEILPPTAIDANGASVPVSLEVSGDSLTVAASPDSGSAFPILVDPTFKYPWYGKAEGNFADWTSESNNSGLIMGIKATCTKSCPTTIQEKPGLDVFAKKASLVAGSNGTWSFYVPRYFSDQAQYGTPPQSFITSMVLQDLVFFSKDQSGAQPIMVSGVWDPLASKYTSALYHGGNEGALTNLTTSYTFGYGGDENAKRAIAAQLYSQETLTMKGERELYVGDATIEVGDGGKPSFGSPTPTLEGWVNSQPTSPINFTVSDAGLGLKKMEVMLEGSDPKKASVTSLSCLSTPSSPCPRTWKSAEVGPPVVKYEPATLPQGEDWLQLIASDAAGNSTTAKVKAKIDHTAPAIALSGTMTEQAGIGVNRPRYVLKAVSTDGTEAAPQSGVVSTEIKVDGKKVDGTSAGCATKNCAVTRAWALESSEYSVGKHVVVAKSTDGVGLTTEKTLTIEIQRDTTKPTIENYGLLYNAPDGWVEQKTYELGINAWDNGYGVTSVEFKMDGSVIKSAKLTCPNGGCTEWLNVAINMAGYKGGAHAAEIVATDGAGNTTKESWTVNVDPKGAVSSAEAIKTLEAVEDTGNTNAVAPTPELYAPTEIANGVNPVLKQTGIELQSAGTGAVMVTTTNPSEGVTIESAEGDIEIEPLSGSGSVAREVTAGAVAVSGGTNVDAAIRPIYDGLMTYQSIRDATAPEGYSWDVSLHPGQTLKAVDLQHAAILNEDGTQGLLITAEPSHDATGKAVPTELVVGGGNILTLTVKHRAGGFVYPVVGGPAFQASYVAPVIYTPPPPPPPGAPEEDWEASELFVSAPEAIAGGEASASGWGEARREFVRIRCGHTSFYPREGGYTQACGNPFTGDQGQSVPWHVALRGAFLYKPGSRAEQKGAIACAQGAYQVSVLSLYYAEAAYQCHYGPKTSDGNGV
jgi:hypothetical protein